MAVCCIVAPPWMGCKAAKQPRILWSPLQVDCATHTLTLRHALCCAPSFCVFHIRPQSHPHPHPHQAQALLQQVERRKLYKFVQEVTLDINAQQRYAAGSQGKPTAEEIVSYQSSADSGVSELLGLLVLLLVVVGCRGSAGVQLVGMGVHCWAAC